MSTQSIPSLAIRRPVLRYHGGKFRLAPNLIALFPEHRVYTEVFGGGGSVLMQKPRCYSEIYNDLDGEVVNVFRVRRIGNRTTPEHRYRWEMTDADHVALAKLLRSLKGMVIISSYPSPLYDRLYRGWRKVSWTGGQFCSQNYGSKTRTEVVWLNPACADAQRQSELFS